MERINKIGCIYTGRYGKFIYGVYINRVVMIRL